MGDQLRVTQWSKMEEQGNGNYDWDRMKVNTGLFQKEGRIGNEREARLDIGIKAKVEESRKHLVEVEETFESKELMSSSDMVEDTLG